MRESESVFIAKGIGIILVVVGHFCPSNSPAYWTELHDIIYSFHMPLFFMLAGYLYGFSPASLSSYFSFLKKKVNRLLIPFISLALLSFVIKGIAGMFVEMDHPVTLNSLLSIFIVPIESYFPLLWFMYALFIMFAMFPLIWIIIKYNNGALLCIVLVLSLFDWTIYFCLNNIFRCLPCFAIGFIMSSNNIRIDRSRKYITYSIVIVCTILFGLLYMFKDSLAQYKYAQLASDQIISISGSIACMYIASALFNLEWTYAKHLGFIGYYSMSIYLLHTLFISTIRITCFSILRVPGFMFLPVAALAVVFGIAVPLFIEKLVLRKYTFTRKLILGLN